MSDTPGRSAGTAAGYTVGDIARLAGVTVRTLHHYDEIGLLSPSGRTMSGYRLYEAGDLERLQRILCYRELGFPLTEIATIIDDPQVDPLEHLRRQHRMLTERVDRLGRIVATVEKAMEAREMGINLEPHELVEVFGEHNPAQYAAEAEERWGDTDAFRESQRRTSTYTKDDWIRMREEASEIEGRLADAMHAGLPPDSAAAMEAAEAHRQHISRWFYDCSREMHRALGEMYVADERFTAHYEAVAAGLGPYVRDTIVANADRS